MADAFSFHLQLSTAVAASLHEADDTHLGDADPWVITEMQIIAYVDAWQPIFDHKLTFFPILASGALCTK